MKALVDIVKQRGPISRADLRYIPGISKKYAINDKGDVFDIDFRSTGQIRKRSSRPTTHGYMRTTIDGRDYHVHKLVALAFIENPENKPTVNHKDGNRKNNALSNLEWATFSENNLHSYRVLGRKAPWKGKFGTNHHSSKKVLVYSLGAKIAEYDNATIAAKAMGISLPMLSMIVSGRRSDRYGRDIRYLQRQWVKSTKLRRER